MGEINLIIKILKKEFFRKKIITAVISVFILLSSLFAASGTNLIIKLSGSVRYLFEKSKIPHFVQMSSGEIDQDKINKWVQNNKYIKETQIVEMINISNSDIQFPNKISMEKYNVMDNSFVKQNDMFDLLLNMENEIITVSKGEIAVPVYYMQKEDLKPGDKIKIINNNFSREYKISDFVRDAQMNPSIVSSKRFVVSNEDFEIIKKNTGKTEYLIEFMLKDLKDLNKFSNEYQISDLPKKGPSIDYNLFKIINTLTDGIIAALIILSSALINIIAVLCLRFSILTTMEEDYKEIGVLKAIGIHENDIKKIYLGKYLVIGCLSSIVGYVLSFFLNKIFTGNIILYTGENQNNILEFIIPFISSMLVFFTVILSCLLTLRRFKKISVIEALRASTLRGKEKTRNYFTLNRFKFLDINIFLGINDIFINFKVYKVLFLVFFISSFLIIVPLNFLNTIKSESFINYMGIGKSDIRIDLQQSEDVGERFEDMLKYIESDKDIEKFSPLVNSNFKMLNNEGEIENINIETGDFSIFPLEYLIGKAPENNNEIALSYLNSKELNKSVNDTIKILIDEKEKILKISGIYQDITNGGKTAKALFSYNKNSVIWYIVNIDINSGVNIKDKTEEYSHLFSPAKITDIEEYMKQTLGNTISQLEFFTVLIIATSFFISMLITFLFLKMMLVKESFEIALMKSLGFKLINIQIQYISKMLFVVSLGIIFGTITSNTLGQNIISLLWSFMGASNIKFVISPLQSYILYPTGLMTVVCIATLASIKSLKNLNMTKVNAE